MVEPECHIDGEHLWREQKKTEGDYEKKHRAQRLRKLKDPALCK